MSKIYLDVSYDQKETAKQYGAKWDRQQQRWYWWQEADTMLPPELIQYAPNGIAMSEDDAKKEISSLIKTLLIDLSDCIREAQSQLSPAVFNDVEGYDSEIGPQALAAIKMMDPTDIVALTKARFAGLTDTDVDHVERMIKKQPYNFMRMLNATLGGKETSTNAEKLIKIRQITAPAVAVNVLAKLVFDEHRQRFLARQDAEKKAAIAEANALLAQIDISDHDINECHQIMIKGHSIECSYYNGDKLVVDKIDGQSEVKTKRGVFADWVHTLDAAKMLSEKMTTCYRTEMVAKARTFKLRASNAVDVKSSDLTLYAKDTRTAKGYIDHDCNDEWVIYQIGAHQVDSSNPIIISLAAEAKSAYKNG